MNERYPDFMSVLNDVATENGLTIRELASVCSHRNARAFMSSLKGKGLYRMDEISYSQPEGVISDSLLEQSNHYWVNDDGVNWGTPSGTFEDYVDRLLADERNWRDEAWFPDTKRETDEIRARDMVAASYLFPFSRHASNPAIELGILPVLRSRKKVLSGSKATASLIASMADSGEEYHALLATRKTDNKAAASAWKDFGSWSTYFEIATSVNSYDAARAGTKMDYLNDDRAVEGIKYSLLADLANTCESVIRSSSRRGRLGKNMTEIMRRIKILQDEVDDSKNPIYIKACEDDLESLRGCLQAEFRKTRSGKSPVYRNNAAADYKILAAGRVVMVQFCRGDPMYLLNSEDLKNLKFVAMSHTMWHMYAATLAIEWAPKTDFSSVSMSADVQLALTGIGQLGAALNSAIGSLAIPRTSHAKQVEVTKSAAEKSIGSIWDFYISRLRTFIDMGLTDYFGRYLSELFSVYTSVLGGEMAKSGYRAQLAEFVDTWEARGIVAEVDVSALIGIFAGCPMTLVQDFGRLAKIVYAYDINPAYSYMARVKDMAKANPRGRAIFTGDYDFGLEQLTTDESKESMLKYRAAIRVLLAIGDARSAASAAVPAEEAEKYADASWETLMAYFGKDASVIGFGTTFLQVAAFDVPAQSRAKARKEAAEFFRTGAMPTTPWAGAFMDTEDLLAYKERGEPDLALLKATSMPPSDIYQAMSSMPGGSKVTPTRDTDGWREEGKGDMISEYLAGTYPSRREALDWVRANVPHTTTSVKIETGKYPLKNRIITASCAAARRIMSEFEFNNGRCFKNVPGFSIGADPAKVKKKMYAAMRADVPSNMARIMVSLDLSSWSTGMYWDVQQACNEELKCAYDGGTDVFAVLDKCTKGTYMLMTQKGLRLPSVNQRGANYEGLDGKRNTLIHCALWYIARCDAYERGLEGNMTALLFIDDGTAVLDVPKRDLIRSVGILRHALLRTYVEYGFKLSLYKTVVSTIYCQFLNEIYYHGAHIGYGFRALCHTGAQTFPQAATVAEELAVISSGIRGAAVSGGHTLRLMAGYHHLLMMYVNGVIGNRGKSLIGLHALPLALLLAMPTIIGGFGLPNMTELFTNLAGHRDVEKMDKIPRLLKALRQFVPDAAQVLRSHIKSCLLDISMLKREYVPSRVGVKSDIITAISARDRATVTANGALLKCTNPSARQLLEEFVSTSSSVDPTSFPAAFISAVKSVGVRLPVAIVERALGSDPSDAISKLVKKIVSSSMIDKFVTREDLTRLKRQYYLDGRKRVGVIREIFGSTVFTN